MKKILIISPYFAPENCIASVRFTKMAKYLKKMGYHVSVICSNHMMVDTEDNILKEDVQELDHIYRVPPILMQRIAQRVKGSLEQKTKSVLNTTGAKTEVICKESKETVAEKFLKSQFYQNLIQRWIYMSEISLGDSYIKYYKKNKTEMGTYDCVISTYGPLSSHIFGKFMKDKRYCEKWISDFRDVVYDTITEKENNIVKKRKKIIAQACMCADKVCAITDEMLRVLEGYTERFCQISIEKKSFCVSNGFDQDDEKYLIDKEKDTKFNFAYCGVIYYNESGTQCNRDPRPLFKAITELIAEGKIEKNNICFHYAGKSFNAFLKMAAEFDLEECVIDHGFVERMESLNIQRNADIILSLSWNTKNDRGIMTGKIYEAFIAGKTVLSLISGDEPNSDLGKMIKNTSIGYVWEQGNGNTMVELKKWILCMYDEKISTGQIKYNGDKNAIEKYSYEYLTRKFAQAIEE